MESNYIKNVAIVGAGGNVGSRITRHLLATQRHTVTAISRAESTSTLPEGVRRINVEYIDIDSIVSALQGQDCLIISLAFTAGPQAQLTLIEAAAQAGVKWILPNDWSPDTAHEGLVKDISSLTPKPDIRKKIAALGKSSYVAVSTGLWYDLCLGVPQIFGIDAVAREATLFDDGTAKISVSTWDHIGRTVAALLSLPVSKAAAGGQPCVEDFRDRNLYTSSFAVSQRDMLESVFRVTKTSENDWKLASQPAAERFELGREARQKGIPGPQGRMVWARCFMPDGAGNHEDGANVNRRLLQLPQEDLDEATTKALDLQQASAAK